MLWTAYKPTTDRCWSPRLSADASTDEMERRENGERSLRRGQRGSKKVAGCKCGTRA